VPLNPARKAGLAGHLPAKNGHFMTIEQKFVTFLQEIPNKISSKISKFK
jgi:hypothetical protein